MSPLLDYFSCKRTPKELLYLNHGDDSGYLEGKVFMVWPPRNGIYRIQFESPQDSTLCRFIVEIPYEDGIVFRSQDRVLIALKGVKVDVQKESSAPLSFPIALRFPHGVVVKYLSGSNAAKFLDTRKDTFVADSEAIASLFPTS